MENIIEVENLTKIYKIPKKQKKLSKIKKRFSWIYREWEEKIGLKNVSFKIKKGEIVGYLGENGSGKSTTIKMLTSILHPTSGNIKIEIENKKYDVIKNRINYTQNIGVVFGNRSILSYDIPVKDSFNLFRAIYQIEKKEFDKRLKYLVKMLEVDKFLEQPYRTLSLGEKMRCEIAASFLHKPKIVFLDEPTIGLDVSAKFQIRKFLKEINKKENVTVILTTHDMGDIERLCEKIIFINKGEKIFDGKLKEFKKNISNEKNINVIYGKISQKEELKKFCKKIFYKKIGENNFTFEIKNDKTFSKQISKIISFGEIIDLNIKEKNLEECVLEFFDKNKKNKK